MIRLVAILLLLLSPLMARADAEPTVQQRNRTFNERALDIEAGGSVRFKNDDTVRHNIAIRSPSGTDATGITEEPGTDRVVAFPTKGDFLIHCLIHPTMKMTVTVK